MKLLEKRRIKDSFIKGKDTIISRLNNVENATDVASLFVSYSNNSMAANNEKPINRSSGMCPEAICMKPNVNATR